jgi:hypothetical protein
MLATSERDTFFYLILHCKRMFGTAWNQPSATIGPENLLLNILLFD